ncbi:MAG: DUF1761 domain-containing protein [Rhodospirillaceae bacterium]|nr:DUF1761 domain-containing protein [Rhodospirillaceae bacterium]
MSLDINWLAVVIAAVVTFVLGGLWYGPLFGKVWRAAEGQTETQPGHQKHPAFVYGLSFALMLIAAAVLAVALGPDPNVQRSFVVGLVVGVGWVATSFGVNYLFAGRRLALFAVDAGYNVVLFALMGLIIGLFG